LDFKLDHTAHSFSLASHRSALCYLLSYRMGAVVVAVESAGFGATAASGDCRSRYLVRSLYWWPCAGIQRMHLARGQANGAGTGSTSTTTAAPPPTSCRDLACPGPEAISAVVFVFICRIARIEDHEELWRAARTES
jgi:hypothetical protein